MKRRDDPFSLAVYEAFGIPRLVQFLDDLIYWVKEISWRRKFWKR